MPKQYGPRVGGVTWTNGPYGEDEITDTDTGRPVAIVNQDWLDGVLAGAGVVQCDAGHIETRLTELRARTIELRAELTKVTAERDELAASFMRLHDLAKKHVGPKK